MLTLIIFLLALGALVTGGYLALRKPVLDWLELRARSRREADERRRRDLGRQTKQDEAITFALSQLGLSDRVKDRAA